MSCPLLQLPELLLERVLAVSGALAAVKQTARQVLGLLAAPFAPAAERRIRFLVSTLHHIEELEVATRAEVLVLVLRALHKSLAETSEVVERVRRGTFVVEASFDIFDLTLRRYYYCLRAMWPLRPLELLLRDPVARAKWVAALGPRRYHTCWREFRRVFLDGVESTTVHALQCLLNFPADDIVTVYKVDLICVLLGPYSQLAVNAKCCLGRGFVGLVNRIEAEEMLRAARPRYMDCGVFLMRMSRTEPEHVAFSCMHRDGRIVHTLNQHPGLTVEQAAARDYPAPAFKRLDATLDHSVLRKKKTMSAYCASPSYVVMFDEEDELPLDQNHVSTDEEAEEAGHDDRVNAAADSDSYVSSPLPPAAAPPPAEAHQRGGYSSFSE